MVSLFRAFIFFSLFPLMVSAARAQRTTKVDFSLRAYRDMHNSEVVTRSFTTELNPAYLQVFYIFQQQWRLIEQNMPFACDSNVLRFLLNLHQIGVPVRYTMAQFLAKGVFDLNQPLTDDRKVTALGMAMITLCFESCCCNNDMQVQEGRRSVEPQHQLESLKMVALLNLRGANPDAPAFTYNGQTFTARQIALGQLPELDNQNHRLRFMPPAGQGALAIFEKFTLRS